MIWNLQSNKPVVKFHDHTAAVKAIGWSPHQNGLLATGGGTADRHIRFWNTHTLQPLHAIDTGSQVCNLMFSKTTHEIVSTHGYSLNQICLWKYPSMQKLQTLTGHSCRVLYLSISPCGENIVTGAGDETLRFWNMFPSLSKGMLNSRQSRIVPNYMDIR
jgi:cell division cycle 20-like protein 1, cofactor of APC complex